MIGADLELHTDEERRFRPGRARGPGKRASRPRGRLELIENGRGGCLVAEPAALGDAIRGLARRTTLQDRLATGGLMAVRERTWERSLAQLASGYARALSRADPRREVARAA